MGPPMPRSASTDSAARRPETSAPWTELVSRWSPATQTCRRPRAPVPAGATGAAGSCRQRARQLVGARAAPHRRCRPRAAGSGGAHLRPVDVHRDRVDHRGGNQHPAVRRVRRRRRAHRDRVRDRRAGGGVEHPRGGGGQVGRGVVVGGDAAGRRFVVQRGEPRRVPGSVATTTARARRVRPRSPRRRGDRRTGASSRSAPWERRSASWLGSACMPRAGTVEAPRTNIRIIRSVNRRDVDISRSSSTPEKNGVSTPRRPRPGCRALRQACCRATSSRERSRSGGSTVRTGGVRRQRGLAHAGRRPEVSAPTAVAGPLERVAERDGRRPSGPPAAGSKARRSSAPRSTVRRSSG